MIEEGEFIQQQPVNKPRVFSQFQHQNINQNQPKQNFPQQTSNLGIQQRQQSQGQFWQNQQQKNQMNNPPNNQQQNNPPYNQQQNNPPYNQQQNNRPYNQQQKFQQNNSQFQQRRFANKKGDQFNQQLKPEQVNMQGVEIFVMMVAEKPSIARSIAESLSGPQGFVQRKGNAKFVSIFEYRGDFQGKKAFFKVTSVTGHVYHTDFPEEYNDWRKVDPISLFDATTVKKETNPGNGLIEHLESEAQGIHYIILWLDNDKEGENICFEVIEHCKKYMVKDPTIVNNVYRAKFSSITKPDIQQAFYSIATGPNYNESISVDARQIIDLKIGVAFSRLQSTYLVKRYEDLAQKKITYGPCQTPTLGFCVNRYEEIQNFVSQAFFKPQIRWQMPGNMLLIIEWAKNRTFDKQEAQRVKIDVEKERQLIVSNVENKQGLKGRPEALNTVLLLKLASSQMGIGPQDAMQVAEKLYLGGYITYPRTESTHYPSKFDFVGVLNIISQNPIFINYIDKMQKSGLEKPKIGKDVGDHPPITPTTKALRQVDPLEAKMYEIVVRHFLATISPDGKFVKKIVTFASPNQKHEFTIKGTTLLNQGFTEITNWIKIHHDNNNNQIPDFQQNDVLEVEKVDIHEGYTTPPDYLTESDLIGEMEKHKIGTDASMAQHIHNICEREYVTVQTNQRKLIPTQLGVALIRAYREIDNELVDPELRSKIEQSVDLIAQGEVDFDEVLTEVLELFKCKFINFKEKIQTLDKHFTTCKFLTIEQAAKMANPYSKCGKCNNQMKFLENSNKFHCEICKYTYNLPKNGVLQLLQGQYCETCNFELVQFSPNYFPEQIYTLCPNCHNNQPPADLKKKLKKPRCPDCQQSRCTYMPNQIIGNCLQCNNGNFLTLDHQQKQQFTCSCSTCGKALNVERSANQCEVCEAYLLKISPLQKGLGSQPLPDMMVCIYCDPGFRKDINLEKTQKQKKMPNFKQNRKFQYKYQKQPGKENKNFKAFNQQKNWNNQQSQQRQPKGVYQGKIFNTQNSSINNLFKVQKKNIIKQDQTLQKNLFNAPGINNNNTQSQLIQQI